MKKFFATKYKIVKNVYFGYECFYKRWYWRKWKVCDTITFGSVTEAAWYIRKFTVKQVNLP